MDDLLARSDSLEEMIDIQKTVHSKLEEAGFHLRKNSSNSRDLLNSLDPKLIESGKTVLFSDAVIVSTFGLNWSVMILKFL